MSAVPHTTCAGTNEERSPSSYLLAPPKGGVAYKMYTVQTSGIKTLCTRKAFINL